MIKPKVGPWTLAELRHVPQNGLNVFSCFHGGGGSTMGYKLAGYNVLGGVEIDPKMMALYRTNHNPKHSFLMGVQEFNEKPDKSLPNDLFSLDILDGSPPCSSFSMSGSREKKWGKSSRFREGQAKQVLDDLFFKFIETASKLKPKVVVAENVKGLIQGNSRGYVKKIFSGLRHAGYSVQLFLLNSALMGVPQARERTFFLAVRNDIKAKKLRLAFNEEQIPLEKAFNGVSSKGGKPTPEFINEFYDRVPPGQDFGRTHLKETGRCGLFNYTRTSKNRPSCTIVATTAPLHWFEKRFFSDDEIACVQSFPTDYNYMGQKVVYVCGMSVPPFMAQRVALEIGRQWLGVSK